MRCKLLSASLFLFGLFDIALLFWMNSAWAPKFILNDPGKAFFHCVLLPIAALIFCSAYSHKEVTRFAETQIKALIAFLAIVGVFTSLLATGNSVITGYCNSHGSPFEYSASSSNPELYKLFFRERADLVGKSRGALFQKANAEIEARYVAITDNLRTDDCIANILQISSFRGVWSAFLTLVGTLFATTIFWSVLAHLFAKQRPTKSMLSAYIASIALILPWLPMRLYSDWYIHFGRVDHGTITSVVVLGGMAFAATVLIYVLSLRQNVRAVSAAVVSGIPVCLSVVAMLKPDWLHGIARTWLALNVVEQLLATLIAALSIVALAWYLSDPPDGK